MAERRKRNARGHLYPLEWVKTTPQDQYADGNRGVWTMSYFGGKWHVALFERGDQPWVELMSDGSKFICEKYCEAQDGD